jgi:hypothetical protein
LKLIGVRVNRPVGGDVWKFASATDQEACRAGRDGYADRPHRRPSHGLLKPIQGCSGAWSICWVGAPLFEPFWTGAEDDADLHCGLSRYSRGPQKTSRARNQINRGTRRRKSRSVKGTVVRATTNLFRHLIFGCAVASLRYDQLTDGQGRKRTLERALPATRKRYVHRLVNAKGTNIQNAPRSDIQNAGTDDEAAIKPLVRLYLSPLWGHVAEWLRNRQTRAKL